MGIRGTGRRSTGVAAACAVLGCIAAGPALAEPTQLAASNDGLGVAVDPSGVAHVAWFNVPASGAHHVEYCRVPAGSTTCAGGVQDLGAVYINGATDSFDNGPLVSAPTASEVDIATSTSHGNGEDTQVWRSTNGGVSFNGGLVGGLPLLQGQYARDLAFSADGSHVAGIDNANNGVGVQVASVSGAASSTHAQLVASGSGNIQSRWVGFNGATPLAAWTDNTQSSVLRAARYIGTGDPNNAANWTAPAALTGLVTDETFEEIVSGVHAQLLTENTQSFYLRPYDGLAAGAPSRSLFCGDEQTLSGNDTAVPAVSQDPTGRISAVIALQRDPTGTLRFVTAADGVHFSTPVTLFSAPYATQGMTDLHVATGSSGRGVVVFSTSAGSGTRAVNLLDVGALPAAGDCPGHALTVTTAGTGGGSVSGNGISCPATCSASYPAGTPVTLTATAVAGSTFSGWTGACSGTASCTVALDADRAVTATFTKIPVPPLPLPVCRSRLGSTVHLGTRKHRIRHPVLKVVASCDQAVNIKVSGRLTFVTRRKGRAHTTRLKLAAAGAGLPAAATRTFTIEVPAKALSALRHGAKVSASVSVAAAGPGGTTSNVLTVKRLRGVRS